jgi:hypothetical protein
MTEKHEDLHRDLEREADDLQRAEDELGDKIDQTRSTWEQNKTSQGVPGAENTPGGLEGLAEREDESSDDADSDSD